MDIMRLKYKIKAVFKPTCWLRNEKKNNLLDKWMWDCLVNHDIEFVDEYHAIIGGKEVWIENAPYANGKLSTNRRFSCGRATAILLQEMTKKYFRDKDDEFFRKELYHNSYSHRKGGVDG